MLIPFCSLNQQKLSTTTSVDHFSVLVNLIADRAPKICIPWLQATANDKKSTKETEALENESKAGISGKLERNKLPTSTVTESKELKVDTPHKETSPQVHYFPVAIKKTVVTSKQGV